MADFYTNSFSDNIRLARSKKLIEPTDGTYNLIRVPKFAFVKQLWLWIETAYSIGAGAPTITIGFIGNGDTADPDAFMTTLECDPTLVGLKTSVAGSAVWADGKYFDSASGVITLTCDDDGATTVGTFTVFGSFAVVH